MSKNNNPRFSRPKQFKPDELETKYKGVESNDELSSVSVPSFGPLAQLPGTWVGKGFNLVELPAFSEGQEFQVKLNDLKETLTFTDDVGQIPNRGNTQPDITYLGLRYLQQIDDSHTNEGLHIEPGLWIYLPGNEVQQEATVVRMGTVPHGDSLLAQGDFFTVEGPPQIGNVDATPFILGEGGERINIDNEEYLSVIKAAADEMGMKLRTVLNPNRLLRKSNKKLEADGKEIISTTVFRMNAKPIGGINDTPIQATPIDVGGIVNIPFVVKNADANSMSVIFWLNTIRDKETGGEFLQLQYTQTVILDFPVPDGNGGMTDIKWPHITVATLTRR